RFGGAHRRCTNLKALQRRACCQCFPQPVRSLAPATPGVAFAVAIRDSTDFLRLAPFRSLTGGLLATRSDYLPRGCLAAEQLLGSQLIVGDRNFDAINNPIDFSRANCVGLLLQRCDLFLKLCVSLSHSDFPNR